MRSDCQSLTTTTNGEGISHQKVNEVTKIVCMFGKFASYQETVSLGPIWFMIHKLQGGTLQNVVTHETQWLTQSLLYVGGPPLRPVYSLSIDCSNHQHRDQQRTWSKLNFNDLRRTLQWFLLFKLILKNFLHSKLCSTKCKACGPTLSSHLLDTVWAFSNTDDLGETFGRNPSKADLLLWFHQVYSHF